MKTITLSHSSFLEICCLLDGTFKPLLGFMDKTEFDSVVNTMRLPDGEPWPLPVILDVDGETARSATSESEVLLVYQGHEVAHMSQITCFSWSDKETSCKKLFGTTDTIHPGVNRVLRQQDWLLGGIVESVRGSRLWEHQGLTPAQTRKIIRERGWSSVVGFQTRNPVHRAHEYLHRNALEFADGLLIHPIVGWTRSGDLRPDVVLRAYEHMIRFYPENRVILSGLRTAMRYAGPREAVFHAIVRRNYGCTHFIVGRDHAGVMGFYGEYDAQRMFEQFPDIGIEILEMRGPRYCSRCEQITTDHSCSHDGSDLLAISGTEIRRLLREGQPIPVEMMRPEISELLIQANSRGELFC